MSAFAAATNDTAAPWTADRWKLVWEESRRAENYPISRWYLRPLAGLLARRLAHSNVRPWQVTIAGFALTLLASGAIAVLPTPSALVCLLILAAWFCDRLDGQLARRQGTATRFGAWLDANLDELADLTLQTAFAYAASFRWGNAAWLLWGAFVTGKYLFMYGLAFEESETADAAPVEHQDQDLVRSIYHWPANADVRIHLAAVAAFCGWLEVELAFIAVYYQVRWIARYVLVARRLRGEAT